MGLLERGEASAEELHGAYLDAIAGRDGEIHAYLKLVEECRGTGVPIAIKDVITTEGIETTAGSKILAGYVPVFDSTVAAQAQAGGPADRSARRTWTSSRWAPRPRTPATARPGTPGIPSGCRAAPRAARRRRSPAGWRPGRSAPTPAARSSSRPRSAASSACARPTAPSRATASSPSPPASTRSARSPRRCATARSSTGSSPGATRSTRPRSSCRARSSCPRREDLKGLRIGVPKEMNEAEGIDAGRQGRDRAGDRALQRSSAPRSRSARCRSRSSTDSPATT